MTIFNSTVTSVHNTCPDVGVPLPKQAISIQKKIVLIVDYALI